jgi:hypothetical protein
MRTPEAELSSLTPVPLEEGDAMRQVDLVGIESHDAKQMKKGDLENRDASSIARKMRRLLANQKIDGVGMCVHLFSDMFCAHARCLYAHWVLGGKFVPARGVAAMAPAGL